jgi:hypothetical protein
MWTTDAIIRPDSMDTSANSRDNLARSNHAERADTQQQCVFFAGELLIYLVSQCWEITALVYVLLTVRFLNRDDENRAAGQRALCI